METVLERANFSQPELVAPPDTQRHGPVPVADNPAMSHEDVGALKKRLAWMRNEWGGMRVKKAFFRCPWPCTRSQYEQYKKLAVEEWLRQMDVEGWDLKSKVFVNADRRRLAYSYSGDWVAGALLDQVEIPAAAVFLKRKVERRRIEVPVQA